MLYPTAGGQAATAEDPQHYITFHSQQRSHLELQLTEVDPFGNHSSPHYKGTAVFYRATREQLRAGEGLQRLDVKTLGDPVCKLNLTLPKVSGPGPPLHSRPPARGGHWYRLSSPPQKERSINRRAAVRMRSCEQRGGGPQPAILRKCSWTNYDDKTNNCFDVRIWLMWVINRF